MTEEDQKTGLIQRLKDLPNGTLFVILPMLPVFYVLSLGPAIWMVEKFRSGQDICEIVYWPVLYWMRNDFVGTGLLYQYALWWDRLG